MKSAEEPRGILKDQKHPCGFERGKGEGTTESNKRKLRRFSDAAPVEINGAAVVFLHILDGCNYSKETVLLMVSTDREEESSEPALPPHPF